MREKISKEIKEGLIERAKDLKQFWKMYRLLIQDLRKNMLKLLKLNKLLNSWLKDKSLLFQEMKMKRMLRLFYLKENQKLQG
ncbi:unnamed protein product [Paramecium sonneborni]|uniref:Uncharacterized protein n=1 Tax=Paramecium sonneborni TaxID=65129 RepID=A0A8S1RQU7_9CILI|nr:unnamed protein product [Paramecium sonneborni]